MWLIGGAAAFREETKRSSAFAEQNLLLTRSTRCNHSRRLWVEASALRETACNHSFLGFNLHQYRKWKNPQRTHFCGNTKAALWNGCKGACIVLSRKAPQETHSPIYLFIYLFTEEKTDWMSKKPLFNLISLDVSTGRVLLGLQALLPCWILLWPAGWRMHPTQPGHLGHFVQGQKNKQWALMLPRRPSPTWMSTTQLVLSAENNRPPGSFLFLAISCVLIFHTSVTCEGICWIFS